MGCFLLGLVLRCYKLNAPPDDFRIARQYNSLLMSRYFATQMQCLASRCVPDWEKAVWRANYEYIQKAELPLNEWFAGTVNALIGRDSYWPARLLPITGWMMGAIFLYLTARMLGLSSYTSILAISIYLLLPLGVVVSRSMQPDSLMLGTMIASLWTLLRYEQCRKPVLLVAGALVSGISVLIKPGPPLPILFLFLAFIEISSRPRSILGILVRIAIFSCGLTAPAGLYMVTQSNQVPAIVKSNFIPRLLTTVYFWKGWLLMLGRVATPFGLLLALLGVPLLISRNWRLAWAWILGYTVLCFVSTYTTPSHEYWHISVLPFFALSTAALCDGGIRAVQSRLRQEVLAVSMTLAFAASGIAVYIDCVRPVQAVDRKDDFVALAKEIGDSVNHNTNCIVLAYSYGRPLCYYGILAGRPWPSSADIWEESLRGEVCDARARMQRLFSESRPRYFIVSRDFKSFYSQKDLVELLHNNADIVVQRDRYMIFDLRKLDPFKKEK